VNRRTALLTLLAAAFGIPTRASEQQEGWVPLFNGKDLEGWDTWLGKPHPSVDVHGLRRDAKGAYVDPVGLNRDPKGVFSVVQADGGPAIRISGEIYGGLITRAEYDSYHLRFEFKWGEKRWPPREQAVRDSGCCYHSIGPHDESYGFWMKSFEFQIQEGDCGDFYGLAGVIADAEAVLVNPSDPKSDPVYTKGAPKIVGVSKRIVKSRASERPRGEWNVLDLYCVGQTSVHVVNGVGNMMLTGLRYRIEEHDVPLTRGRIQFQSEGAEVFYRNLAIRPWAEIPAGFAA
jgi:hypothetical protein